MPPRKRSAPDGDGDPGLSKRVKPPDTPFADSLLPTPSPTVDRARAKAEREAAKAEAERNKADAKRLKDEERRNKDEEKRLKDEIKKAKAAARSAKRAAQADAEFRMSLLTHAPRLTIDRRKSLVDTANDSAKSHDATHVYGRARNQVHARPGLRQVRSRTSRAYPN